MVVCPSHVFKRKPCPICSVKISKRDGDGQKKIEALVQ